MRDHNKRSVELTRKFKKYVDLNNKIHINRLNPHYKLNLDAKTKLRFTPLGGLCEIGGNMAVLETVDEAIIIDVGMSFPSPDMHGVDILVPDFSYLKSIQKKIKAVIITHAHEDHIGAMPYLFKELQFPVYGTSLALEMIAAKFDEHRLSKFNSMLHPIEKRTLVDIGKDFKIEWMHVTHSIIDCSSLAIVTEAGTIIHTGDFKIDHTPVDNFPTDLHRFAHYGEQGVLLLLSDSTNSYKNDVTPSERTVAPALEQIFKEAQGRILLSTFSSNAHRIYQAMECAMRHGRKICIIGRSMEKNMNIAMDLGYLRLPKDAIVGIEEVHRLDDKEVLIVTTGSQGEPRSALFRIAVGEHKQIKLQPEDTVVLSAKAIPGNEGSVSILLNHILKCGAKAVYQDYHIHVSGHASREEQKLMLRLCKPKFFLPVHGEYNHITEHAKTAVKCGVLEKNIVIMEDGDTIEIHPKYMKKVASVKSGKSFVDNNNNRIIENSVVAERQRLAEDGLIVVALPIDRANKTLANPPRLNTYGLVGNIDSKNLCKDLGAMVEAYFKQAGVKNNKAIENDVRTLIKKHIVRLYRKYPGIDVMVLD